MKKVVDEFGRELCVDETTQKLYSFCNKNKRIGYTAEIMENDVNTGFWTNYIEEGVVTDIEQKLLTWNNALLFSYAKVVGFKASKNDPNSEIWKKFVEYVKGNESKFFDKNGDFRKEILLMESKKKVNKHPKI